MVVKQFWTKSNKIQWWECKSIIFIPFAEKKDKIPATDAKVHLYDEKGEIIRTIDFVTVCNCNFILYFLENGKTVDTMKHVNKL